MKMFLKDRKVSLDSDCVTVLVLSQLTDVSVVDGALLSLAQQEVPGPEVLLLPPPLPGPEPGRQHQVPPLDR